MQAGGPSHVRWFVAALLVVVAVALACGGAGSHLAASSAAAGDHITGAQSCPVDQEQDLTLSGGLTGHIVCSIAPPVCHRTHGPGSPGVQVLILAVAGSKTVILRIAFGNDHLGNFTATPIADELSLDQQGVTLKGSGTWISQADGGTMTVQVEEPPSLSTVGRVSGSLDVRLISGNSSAEVKGTWTCFKTLAGGDGWSSA